MVDDNYSDDDYEIALSTPNVASSTLQQKPLPSKKPLVTLKVMGGAQVKSSDKLFKLQSDHYEDSD